MRSALAQVAVAANKAQRRQRSTSLSTVPPATTSDDYTPHLAITAASILYRSPLRSRQGRPIYILNAAAFPDALECDYDSLLSYVLARLPGEDELLSGTEYEIIFFAGGQPDNATAEKKQGPGMGWYLQAYHVLSRATRKRLQRLYIVHPRTWVRVLVGVFGTIVSPKFRRKIIHVNTLTQLALNIPMETLLIPPNVYMHDRRLEQDIYVPFATGRRAFGVKHPLPKSMESGHSRLPRVLRETTAFLMMPSCVRLEGIFRIPPNAILLSALKEAYDRGQQFIVWKERGATVVQPGIDQALVDEVRLEDAYGAHLAASLIKQWYRDLREPVFPESSYEAVKDRYGNAEVQIRSEDLVDLLLPASELSPVSKTSRKILTRHLLPMLSEVASHESENKMNPENLAILFSMCLLCGSNQLEDAKVASIVKRILQAAIEMWPELRTGMEIPADKFLQDLQPPEDFKDYEDPLEEEMPPRSKHVSADDDAWSSQEGHRIEMEDAESGVIASERTPTLPPRRQDENTAQRAPTLPPRPVSRSRDAPAIGIVKSDVPPAVPKRKPAPTIEPPRYSTVFDTDGNSIHVADSPASYVPVDGFGPPRQGPWSYDESEKKGFHPDPIDPQAALNMPKRKALSHEPKAPEPSTTLTPDPLTTTRSASDGPALAHEAAQKAAATLAQQAAAAFAEKNDTSPVLLQSPETITTSTSTDKEDNLFRKPSWPASARPLIQPQSLAKPMLPPRQSQTFPLPSTGTSTSMSNANGTLAAPGSAVPRPRAPSPGLLKRMSEMGVATTTGEMKSPGLEPRRLDLKKASVEDLRRLYEERGRTAEGLARAEAVRRGSTST